MHAGVIAARLDAELDTAASVDIDASPNGSQVGRADRSVDHVAVAADAAVETIEWRPRPARTCS